MMMRWLFMSFVCYFLVIGDAYARDGQAAQTAHFLDIQQVENAGVTAWLVEDHSVPVIAMAFSFRDAGAKNDPPDLQGLARLASNTMDEGAGDLSSQAFQKALRDQSISLSFSASRDHFGGTLKTLTENKADAFHLLKLSLSVPRFDAEPVERMRQSNKSRIRSSLSDPRWIAARIQNDRIFEGHPYALNSGGTLSSLERITPEDLKAFHKTLGRNQLVIGVAGDITAEELKGVLSDVFGAMPEVEERSFIRFPLQNTGQTYLYQQDIPQSVIQMTQNGINRQDSDYYDARVMNFILGESGFGSRLMEELREKRGLTYGVYGYFQSYEDNDVLQVSTSTANENVPEVLSLIRAQWQKMKTDPVSDQELADAKSYLIGSMPLSLTSTDSIASTLLSLQMDHLPIDYLDVRAQRLDAVQVDDVQNSARRLLDEAAMTTVIVGMPAGVQDAQMIETLPNVE